MYVYLKQSGELLRDEDSTDIWTPEAVDAAARNIGELHKAAAEVGVRGLMVVTGGGNIARGDRMKGFDTPAMRRRRHAVGRLATAQNAVMLSGALEDREVPHTVMVASRVNYYDPSLDGIVQPFSSAARDDAFKKKKVIVIAYGTGLDNQTTDAATAEYAVDGAKSLPGEHRIYKETAHVDAIYSDDPRTNPDAQPHDVISAGYMLNNYDSYGVVDRRSLEIMAGLSSDTSVSMQVFGNSKATPLDVLTAPDPIGTIVVPGYDTPTLV